MPTDRIDVVVDRELWTTDQAVDSGCSVDEPVDEAAVATASSEQSRGPSTASVSPFGSSAAEAANHCAASSRRPSSSSVSA